MTAQHQRADRRDRRDRRDRMSSEYSGYRNGHTVGSAAQYRQRSRKAKVPPDQGLSNGLIILVIAIVVGCFAVLWPKYFYPMLFGKTLLC